ncbi:adenosylcobinamide-GDP ribazoletransferase [Rhodoblastus acidophilus]|uniref:Adenosylcobinamide-GDP ribazoletransferase n=1 Tax=Candidatus Rhodoblastus alkanivorans TaxID=2954117 RepID=A0ABS9ZCX4_9HYPH|nr:adenosylcobinamide-GDP ribazoletransferase [Candidatus Rhodoblastus alkanivorans]MCI4680819.1 adenosylcobinamide-GDP ribazoletransferase [Candidatus Rhodoblastus alkanivorans]MCI4684382.1 adenosylcobinamide-GDP ribazoletransferase [Candidatus Rhodoblastus alkanivorans]
MRDLAGALKFFSSLPIPAPGGDFRQSLRLAPLAGAMLGLAGGLVFVAALRLRLPAGAAALLALGFGALITRGLHEDGLADVADGFGGGFTRQRKLDIMKDSRIGAFGAIVLILSLGLRASALAALATAPASAFLVMIAAGAVSRAAALAPLVLLPPARADGAGRAAGGENAGLRPAFWLALPFAFLPALGASSLSACLAALVAASGGVLGLCALARAQIGGQTGDVAGAAQQIAEIAVLLTFSAAA